MPQSAVAAAPVSASTTNTHSQEELQRTVVEILRKQSGQRMKAKDLIDQIHKEWSVDRDSIRRAMLSLSADGRTAYTSEWDIFLTGRN